MWCISFATLLIMTLLHNEGTKNVSQKSYGHWETYSTLSRMIFLSVKGVNESEIHFSNPRRSKGGGPCVELCMRFSLLLRFYQCFACALLPGIFQCFRRYRVMVKITGYCHQQNVLSQRAMCYNAIGSMRDRGTLG